MKKLLKYILGFAFAITLIGGLGIAGIMLKYYKELPNVSELVENYSPPIPTTIYDRNGQVIDTISKESRELVDIADVPENLQNAFMAIEDRHFRTHCGIDPIRIIGSAIKNIKSGRAAQGGSTITQQLARNAFLTQEKKMSRKIKEVIITFEIERKYTKDEIMEKYLNEIYFGSGSYGVKTAAYNFFRKDIKDINLPEAALLAGIPNRPNTYNPRIHLDYSLKRQKLVLKQMLKYKFITQDEYDKAIEHKFIEEKDATKQDKKDPNVTVIYGGTDENGNMKAPDFTDMVKEYLFENLDESIIYSNGLKVYTTIDMNFQKTAKEVFETYGPLKNNKKLQGAMVTIDARNGEVISIIGGKNFKTGEFNRAIHAKRQYGSSFKPFVYFTAIERKKLDENTIIEDAPITYGKWSPRNYGNRYYGNITMMNAFDKSLNIVAIKLLDMVGVDALKETMRKIGTGINVPDSLTAALGTAEGSPLQLAESYAIFANGGYPVKPILVTKIVDKNNNVIFENKPQLISKFSSLDIALTLNMLKNSVRHGTSSEAEVIYNGKTIEQGGKTGTTNNSRTVWFAGFTPDYVTAIYIGYDNNKPLYGATGGKMAAPLWRKYYTALIKNGYYTPSKKFLFLDNHLKNGDLVYQTLDPYTGLISDSGQDFLIRRGKMVVEKATTYDQGLSDVINEPIPDPNQAQQINGTTTDGTMGTNPQPPMDNQQTIPTSSEGVQQPQNQNTTPINNNVTTSNENTDNKTQTAPENSVEEPKKEEPKEEKQEQVEEPKNNDEKVIMGGNTHNGFFRNNHKKKEE